MTDQPSFSELLQAKLDEDAAELEKAKQAMEQEQWIERVNTIAAWMQKVFNDESFELLGYKLKKRKKSRKGDHILTVYVRVGKLVFGLETSKNLNRYKANFGICVLRTGRSGVSSQLFKLQQIYKENNALSRLEFQADFSDLSGQPITQGTAQGVMGRKQLCEEIVVATKNVVIRRPEQLDDNTMQTIIADLSKHKGMQMLMQSDTIVPDDLSLDVQRYIARVPDDILNMSLEMLVETPYTERAVQYRNECLAELQSHGVITVRDVLPLTYQELSNRCNGSWWGTLGIVEALSVLKLELVPPNNAPYLPAGTPATVIGLLEYSGFKSYERARNCLARAQITTTQQLLQKDRNDLLAITNFGQQSLEIVETALLKCGLRLKPPSY